ncbi:MAG: hypothetical protein WCP11_02360 [Candidatus Saccharibacteria bacterium]
MLDMNKHIVKTDDDQSFHTSGYAVAANGNRIGSTSTESFQQRQERERNRQKIGSYRQSAVGLSYAAARPKTVEASAITNRNAINQASSAPSVPAPPPRYNPYV